MRRALFLATTCVVFHGVVFHGDPLHAQLRVSPGRLDFGESGHGEKRRLKLTLENTGKTPLRIVEMKSSCGCTTLQPKRFSKPLAPGSSVRVNVTMSSGRALGTLNKYITIRTNPGVQPIRVPTLLRVFPGFETRPGQLRFEGEVAGKPVTKTVDVLRRAPGRGGGTFRFSLEGVVDARRPRRSLDAHFASRVEDIPGGKRVHLTLKPTHPEGRVSGTLLAELDGKPFHVPVTGHMFRWLKQSPNYFNFNRVDLGKKETLVEESRLIAIDGQPLEIVDTEVTFLSNAGADLDLDITTERLGKGGKYRIRVVLLFRGDKKPKGTFSGKVVVRTDRLEKPEVTYNVFGFFPAR